MNDNKLDEALPEELGGVSSSPHSGLPFPQVAPPSGLAFVWVVPTFSCSTRWRDDDCAGDMENLRDIRLHDNFIPGQIPESIGKLLKLRYLDFYNNQMIGDIPAGERPYSKQVQWQSLRQAQVQWQQA